MSLPLGWGASIATRCGGMADSELGGSPCQLQSDVVTQQTRRWGRRLQSDAVTHQTLRRERRSDLGGGDMLDWESGPWGLSCIMMRRRIRPRGVGGRCRLESEPSHDVLGVRCEEPRDCHYRRRHNDLVGGGGHRPW
jgi:hypothetical protein